MQMQIVGGCLCVGLVGSSIRWSLETFDQNILKIFKAAWTFHFKSNLCNQTMLMTRRSRFRKANGAAKPTALECVYIITVLSLMSFSLCNMALAKLFMLCARWDGGGRAAKRQIRLQMRYINFRMWWALVASFEGVVSRWRSSNSLANYECKWIHGEMQLNTCKLTFYQSSSPSSSSYDFSLQFDWNKLVFARRAGALVVP